MRLNEMLHNYINQNSASAKTSGPVQIQQLPGQIAAQIKALSPGQILQGEVLENLGDTVKLLINMNGENIPIQARLEQSLMLSMGKNLLFQVKNNDSTLSLSPLFENLGMEQNATKALETASLPVNETTMGMTAQLMKEGISIDKNTLQEIYHQMVSNADAELMDIIDLHKLKLPVNTENLNQIHSYKAMTHQLAGGVEQIGQELTGLLKNFATNGQEKSAEALLNAVLHDGEEILPQNEKGAELAVKTVLTEKSILSDFATGQGNDQVANDIDTASGKVDPSMPDTIKYKAMSTQELLQELNSLLEKCQGDNKAIANLMQKDFFQEALKEFLQKKLLMQPEDAQKDGVKELYQRLNRQLIHLTESLQNVGQEQSSLAKTVQNLNQNVQFLNQMNQMYAYIQLPLKLSENNAHGELYVYSNKKHLAGEEGEVTALLHLDMEHLGPVDVYVRMKENKVSTNFYIGDDEMLDFLYEHMDILTQRLEKRGYKMSYQMTVKGDLGERENTTFGQLLQENSNRPALVNYSFDVRC